MKRKGRGRRFVLETGVGKEDPRGTPYGTPGGWCFLLNPRGPGSKEVGKKEKVLKGLSFLVFLWSLRSPLFLLLSFSYSLSLCVCVTVSLSNQRFSDK